MDGVSIILRAVEPGDVDVMYGWENDPDNWHISSTRQPLSRHMLDMFVESQHQGDLLQGRDIRLMVCEKESREVVGCVDLFDIDIYNHRAGVGVLIDRNYRRRGYAENALLAVELFVRSRLDLRQLWCNVESGNVASLSLFEKLGYSSVGVKRGWNWSVDGFADEILMQKLFFNVK